MWTVIESLHEFRSTSQTWETALFQLVNKENKRDLSSKYNSVGDLSSVLLHLSAATFSSTARRLTYFAISCNDQTFPFNSSNFD